MCGDMTWGVSFDGSQDVEACGTLATVNCSVGTYGDSTTVPSITVNGKGLITCVTTCGINFSTATVCQADTVKTGTGSCAANYIGFFELSGSGCYQEPKVDTNFLYDASNNKLTVPKIKPGQIIDSNDGTGTENYVIKADGNGGWAWGQVDGGSVGTLNFTDLDDTPANYTNHANKLVRVNKEGSTNNGTALEFVDPSSVGAQKFTDLDDTPSSIANPGDDGKIVKVSAGALVFDTVSGLGGITDVTVDYTNRSAPCALPITVTEPSTGTKQINIPSNSNAFGARFVQSTTPTNPCDGDIWFDTSTSGDGTSRVAVIRDEKSAGTYGGKVGTGDYVNKRAYWNGTNIQADSWFPRVLNTKYDPSNFVSLGNGVEAGNQYSNTFSLAAGKYKISWRVPAHQVDRFQSRLAYNTNDDFSGTTSYYYGTSQYSGVDSSVSGGGAASDSEDESEGEFVADISATTYFRIEQWIYSSGQTGTFGDGALGVAVSRNTANNTNLNLGNTEVYTQVKIEDLATAVKTGVSASDKIEEGNTSVETVDTGSDGHVKITTEGEERFRVNSDGDVVFSHLRASDAQQITGGGIYRRVIQIDDSATADGSPVNQTQALFRIGQAHGSFAGTLYVTVNNENISMSKVYHFVTAFGTGGADRIRTMAGITNYGTFNFGAGIKYNSTLTDAGYYRDLCVQVNYTKNRDISGNATVGPASPNISATLILAQNSTDINVTKPTQSYSSLTQVADTPPPSYTSSGMIGEMVANGGYIYVCVGNALWKRISLAGSDTW